MSYFDLRLCVPVVINMVKSQGWGWGWDWDWDPFHITLHLTWINIPCFLLIMAGFSLISIEVPLTFFACSLHSVHVRLRIGSRSLSTAVSLMASLIFPRLLFWYIYPFILLASFFPTARLLHVLRPLQAVIPTNQVYDISISTAAARVNEPHAQQDLEAHIEAQ